MSIFLRGLVSTSTSTFPNINLSEKNDRFKCCLKTQSKKTLFLMSICSHGQVIPSTATYSNINLTKSIKNLLVISKITEKMMQKSLGLLLQL